MTSQINLPDDFQGIIYKITSKTTNKSYIGQTLSHCFKNPEWIKTGINNRWKKHMNESKKFKDRPLYKDMNEIGIHDFHV
jgi:hypothetical protein